MKNKTLLDLLKNASGQPPEMQYIPGGSGLPFFMRKAIESEGDASGPSRIGGPEEAKLLANDIVSILKALKLAKDQYVVFGSGPMAMAGLRPARDIDLLVKPEVLEALSKIFPAEGEGVRIHDLIRAYATWPQTDTGGVFERSKEIEGIPFASLEDVLEWKKKMMREKDIPDIALLQKYLSDAHKEASLQKTREKLSRLIATSRHK